MTSVFFFKQKTAYELRISDWSSDVCSSDLHYVVAAYMLAQIRAINNDLPRITPGLIRSAPDSLTLAGPVLNAIRREDWETLRRKGDVVVPEGYQSVPFMRGDPIDRKSTRLNSSP